jgi:hypothetical protein
VSGQRHAPATLYPGERTPGTHCTGGWVGPRAGLDTVVRGKIICPFRGSNPNRPVVQSLDTILTELLRLIYIVIINPLRNSRNYMHCLGAGVAVSIVSGYEPDDRAIEVRTPAKARDFSSNLCVQTGSEAHTAFCAMGIGGPFTGVKRGRA